jgi:hypothetical protein
MARGGHGLPKVSPGLAMLYTFWVATPETAVLEMAVRKVDGLRLSSTPLDNPRRMPLLGNENDRDHTRVVVVVAVVVVVVVVVVVGVVESLDMSFWGRVNSSDNTYEFE